MSNELLASKVIVQEAAPGIANISLRPSAVLGAVGLTERGPIAEPTLVSSWSDFQRIFGGFKSGAELPQAIAGFFENGGSAAYIVRTCHFTDNTDASTAAAARSTANLTTAGDATPAELVGADLPLNLEPGDAIVLQVNGGGDDTATFDAAAAYDQTAAGNFDLEDGWTLTFRIDGASAELQTFTIAAANVVDIDAVTPAELAREFNLQARGCFASVVGSDVRITSDTRGTASRVIIVGGTMAATLNFDGETVGTGDVANIEAVTLAELEAVIEADIAGVAVVASGDAWKIQTVATGEAATLDSQAGTSSRFGLSGDAVTGADDSSVNAFRIEGKTPGVYGDSISVKVQAATSGEASRFNLQVLVGGVVVKTHPNLHYDSDDDRYIVDVLAAESDLVRAVDLSADARPENQTKTLAGGNDGLTGLVDADFSGGVGTSRTGLRALDTVLDLGLVISPDRATNAVHNAMLTYCETTRDGLCFAILDPPAGQSASQIITYVETTASLLGASEYGAMYWPRVKIANPRTAVFGSAAQITVPPSGILAGIYARTDGLTGGVYQSPAGTERGVMFGVLGFESNDVLLESVRDLIYPKRINPLTTGPGLPRFVDGGRTLKGAGNFPNIAERRGVIGIKRSIKTDTQWARHANNDESLWARLRRSVTAFLVGEMRKGAFATRDPATAFVVTVDSSNNPASEVFAGRVNITVGLATQKPAEFVIFTLSQDTRAIDAQLGS